jgi:hypothetical protein
MDSYGLPVMWRILATVDRALAAPDETAGWPLLEEACRTFDEEWRTGSWEFWLRPFDSLEAVIREVRSLSPDEDLVDDPDDPDDLGLLCRRCFEDPEANQKLRAYLREFVRM